jgi:hypothetical protein
MRRRGADCLVVVMKRGNAGGAKGAGHRRWAWANWVKPGGARRFSGRRQPSCGDTSRMNLEVQVRICEGLGVKFPGPTRHELLPTLCSGGDRCSEVTGLDWSRWEIGFSGPWRHSYRRLDWANPIKRLTPNGVQVALPACGALLGRLGPDDKRRICGRSDAQIRPRQLGGQGCGRYDARICPRQLGRLGRDTAGGRCS